MKEDFRVLDWLIKRLVAAYGPRLVRRELRLWHKYLKIEEEQNARSRTLSRS